MIFPRLRVFVSSKIQELSPEREAVKAALRDLHIDAWVFEADAGARPRTVQETYLEEVRDADLYLGLFWKQYGEFTVEEFRYARSLGKDCLVYEKRTDVKGRRDSRLVAFLRALRTVDSGVTIRLFQTLEDLAECVKQDVARWQAAIIRGSAPRVYSERAPRSQDELLADYQLYLLSRVSSVRAFGGARTLPLEDAFVEPRLVNGTRYSSTPSASEQIADSDLLRDRDIFEVPDDTDYSAPNISNDPDYEAKQKNYFSHPLTSILRHRQGAIIAGASGSGKTTLLKYLVMKALNTTSYLPVLLEFKTVTQNLFTETNGDLAELVFRKGLAEPLGVSSSVEEQPLRDLFFQKLRGGRVNLYLDGLDEVRRLTFFPALCHAINTFIGSSPAGTLLIITTRPYALTTSFQRLRRLAIEPLDPSQIARFLSHYCGNASLAKQLTLQIRAHRELSDLARVPLLLGIIAELLLDQHVHLVGARSILYRSVIDALVSRLDNEKAVDRFLITDPNGLLKRTVLKSLAFEGLLSDRDNRDSPQLVFTEEDILDRARDFCPAQVSPFDLASDLIATPLIRELGDSTYAFAHLTLQEYLAAEVLTKSPDCDAIFFRTVFDPLMVETEVLPMAIGLMRSPGRIYETLEKLPESLTFANLRLRARGLGYSTSVPESNVTKLVDQVAGVLAQQDARCTAYSDALIRSFASLHAGYIHAVVGRLIPLLTHDRYPTRLYAANILGSIGDSSAAPALLRTLVDHPKDSYSDIRHAAVAALGKIGDVCGVKTIIALLSDADEHIRYMSAEVLGALADLEAVQGLLSACGDGWTIVAWRARKSLEEIAEAHSADEIIGFIRRKQAPKKVLNSGSKALGTKTDDLRTIDWLLGLAHETPRVQGALRWLASAALMKFSGDLLLRALLQFLKGRASELSREICALLDKTQSREVVSYLLPALVHPDKLVRRGAAKALGEIGDERALVALVESLKREYRDGIHDGGAYILTGPLFSLHFSMET